MIRLDGKHPIGVFDSGVGGLSVLRAIWQELPHERTIYLADQANVPYGSRSLQEVRTFAEEITRYLLKLGAKLIVVACNTASAAALHHLRRIFEDIPFVGMEPAVKPAAERTLSGVVGVLATPATFQGELYASVVERFAEGVTLLQDTCPGLVQLIERGYLTSPETRAILENALRPMLAQNVDTIVLGCTHYPFVIPLIEQIIGPDIRVIDPAPAVSRQVRRLLSEHSLLSGGGESPTPNLVSTTNPQGITRFLTTGEPARLSALIIKLLDLKVEVHAIQWRANKLTG